MPVCTRTVLMTRVDSLDSIIRVLVHSTIFPYNCYVNKVRKTKNSCRHALRTLLARYALYAILEDTHANVSKFSYIFNLVYATRLVSLLVPRDQSPVFETPEVAFTAFGRQEKSEVTHENCTVQRRFNISSYKSFDVPPVVLLHSVGNLRKLAQNCLISY